MSFALRLTSIASMIICSVTRIAGKRPINKKAHIVPSSLPFFDPVATPNINKKHMAETDANTIPIIGLIVLNGETSFTTLTKKEIIPTTNDTKTPTPINKDIAVVCSLECAYKYTPLPTDCAHVARNNPAINNIIRSLMLFISVPPFQISIFS
jgi:hypothetical protein